VRRTKALEKCELTGHSTLTVRPKTIQAKRAANCGQPKFSQIVKVDYLLDFGRLFLDFSIDLWPSIDLEEEWRQAGHEQGGPGEDEGFECEGRRKQRPNKQRSDRTDDEGEQIERMRPNASAERRAQMRQAIEIIYLRRFLHQKMQQEANFAGGQVMPVMFMAAEERERERERPKGRTKVRTKQKVIGNRTEE
jgi:hypothetical protein